MEPALAVTSQDLRVEVVHDWADVASFEREWDELAERTHAEISSCPGYAKVWWRHYGRGKLAIVVGRDRDRLVGVLPFFISRIGPWPLGVKVAKLIGSDSTIAVLRPALDPAFAASLVRLACEQIGSLGCSVIHVGPVQGDTPSTGALRRLFDSEATAHGGSLWQCRERAVGVCTRWNLPATFEDYLASLDKSDRSNLKRNLNKVSKATASNVRVVTEQQEVAAAFERFVPMHARQWNAEGKPGHFGDWPFSVPFAREAIATLSTQSRVSFVEQDIDGECICSYWSYILGNHAFWRLPAREVGEKWDAYALGRVGLVTMLREFIRRGVREVDGGPGHYEYKLRLGATEHPLVSLLFVRQSGMASSRAYVLERYADAVHLIYYRVWRLKTAPRLGIRSRALRYFWMRSRI